ncbi:hypothetical protein Tco_1333251 [Tanacetum coccineum]
MALEHVAMCVLLSRSIQSQRNNGEKGSDKIEDDSYKGMGSKVGEVDGNKGFDGDLNGIQFPPINGMVENENENIERSKECLDKGSNSEDSSVRNDDCVEVVNEDEDEEVVK